MAPSMSPQKPRDDQLPQSGLRDRPHVLALIRTVTEAPVLLAVTGWSTLAATPLGVATLPLNPQSAASAF
jgi:hypothetical protein